MIVLGPTLETDRLILRPPVQPDLDAWAAFMADEEAAKFIGGTAPRSTVWRGMASMAGSWALLGFGMFSVLERATGRWVGRLGPWCPEGWPGFDLGWMLRRSFWGCGYATEGAAAALRYAFTHLGRPHVISLIHPENKASIQVAERLGGRRVDSTEVMGKPALRYRITREEWEGRTATARRERLATSSGWN